MNATFSFSECYSWNLQLEHKLRNNAYQDEFCMLCAKYILYKLFFHNLHIGKLLKLPLHTVIMLF